MWGDEKKHELWREKFSGSNNPMYGKGHLLQGGRNGHATRRFFYKNLTFDCAKDLIKYLNSIGYTQITKSVIIRLVNGKSKKRAYNKFKDVFDNLRWEFKNSEN